MGSQAALGVLAFVPAIIGWAIMHFTNDAIITIVGLIITFAIGIAGYHFGVQKFGVTEALGKEFLKMKDNLKLGAIFLGAGAAGIALVSVLWSMFVPPLGWNSLVMPFPDFGESKGLNISYFVAFAIFYLIYAAMENVYYYWFIGSEWNEKSGAGALMDMAAGQTISFSSCLVIGLGVFALNWAIFSSFVQSWWFGGIIALIAFGAAFALTKIRGSKGIIVSTLLRVGIALGVLLYIYYLFQSDAGKLNRKSPLAFVSSNPLNILSKGGDDAEAGAAAGSASDSPVASAARMLLGF